MERGRFGKQVSREGHRQQERNSHAARGRRTPAERQGFDAESQFVACLPSGRIERRVRPTPIARPVHGVSDAAQEERRGGVIVAPTTSQLMRFFKTPVGDFFRRWRTP